MARSSCATSTTGPAGLGLLWWPRRSVLTATVHSFMSLYFYNLRINFISLLLQTIFIQHFITIHMCEHGTFVNFANTCFTLFIFSILFCLLVVQRREMHEETACIPKAYCMQKYAPDWTIWGPKLKKVLTVGGGPTPLPHPPPARSLRSLGLGRFAPSQSRNNIRNFLFEMLGGLLIIIIIFPSYIAHITSKWRLYALEALLPQL